MLRTVITWKRNHFTIWEKLGIEIDNGNLLSSTEILEELKDKDLVKWTKQYKHAIVPLTKVIQDN